MVQVEGGLPGVHPRSSLTTTASHLDKNRTITSSSQYPPAGD
ncbi:MAG: hypothetical protein PVG54_11760 [Anaerolineae bacterium]